MVQSLTVIFDPSTANRASCRDKKLYACATCGLRLKGPSRAILISPVFRISKRSKISQPQVCSYAANRRRGGCGLLIFNALKVQQQLYPLAMSTPVGHAHQFLKLTQAPDHSCVELVHKRGINVLNDPALNKVIEFWQCNWDWRQQQAIIPTYKPCRAQDSPWPNESVLVCVGFCLLGSSAQTSR